MDQGQEATHGGLRRYRHRWRQELPVAGPRSASRGWAVSPLRTPRGCHLSSCADAANAIAERVIGTLRRECLDHLIVLDEHHLSSVVREFVAYYNQERPHRTLGLQTPQLKVRPTAGSLRSRPVLNGLHHIYERAA